MAASGAGTGSRATAPRLVLEVAPLAFTALSAGEGDLVLLIHGFPDGPETFKDLAALLAAAGFRAVAVTLRGYERSSLARSSAFSLADLAEDVWGWLDALKAPKVHLVGHDWGASHAFAAAAARPERIESLAVIAVPHPGRFMTAVAKDPGQALRSSYMMFFQLRGLSDWWVGRNDADFIRRIWARWSPGWRPDPAILGAQRRRFADPDVRRAALAYYRCALDPRHPRAAETAALLGRPITVRTLGLCGDQDGCISAEVFA